MSILDWLQELCKPTNLCKCGCGKVTARKGSDYCYGHNPHKLEKTYWHEQAWYKFGKDYCEVCGLSDVKHQRKYRCRLSMHNTLTPKDYKVMKPKAWLCVCNKCHTKLEIKQAKLP